MDSDEDYGVEDNDDIYGEISIGMDYTTKLYVVLHQSKDKDDKGKYFCSYAMMVDDNTCYSEHGYYSISEGESALMLTVEVLSKITTVKTVEIYTDSDFVRRGITEWIHDWINPPKGRAAWRTTKGADIKHRDWWMKLYNLTKELNLVWLPLKNSEGHFETPYSVMYKYHEISKNPAASLGKPAVIIEEPKEKKSRTVASMVDVMLDYMYNADEKAENILREEKVIE